MRLDDDYKDINDRERFQPGVLLACLLGVITIVIIVFALNKDKKKPAALVSEEINETASLELSDDSYEKSYSSLRPSDLDFYDMYPEDDTLAVSDNDPEEEEETEDPATDGKHTLIKYDDGSEEWVSISKYITKNIYDFTNLSNHDGIMEYTYNGSKISSFGIDVSKDQDYIDYVKLKKAGVDFVMIRVGARGYSSGQIVMDDYFEDNIRRATAAGLDVGVYFLSQAITEEEATEEAELVLESVADYKLLYPIAFVMELREGETSRVEALSKAEKTKVARAFLKTIDDAGYKTLIYGTKTWLIKYLELNKIVSDYDVWLSELEDIPTYPYEFTMWQYNKQGTLPGIKGYVNFNICLVDYSLR